MAAWSKQRSTSGSRQRNYGEQRASCSVVGRVAAGRRGGEACVLLDVSPRQLAMRGSNIAGVAGACAIGGAAYPGGTCRF